MDVFLDLLESGNIERISVDIEQSDQILRLLDSVVIKLEGGTEEDLKILDVKPPKPVTHTEPIAVSKKEEVKENKAPVEKKVEER